MSTRQIASAAALLLAVAACGGAAGPAPTTPAGTASASSASQPASTAGAIDLSAVDVCALVGDSLAATLTGETGFTTSSNADASSATCFWAVARPGVPQYLEVRAFRRTAGLGDYTPTVSGATCTGASVSGVGAEARGGACVGVQQKVWFVAMDGGVAVQVLVNEPKPALTPADLVAAASAVIAGLG